MLMFRQAGEDLEEEEETKSEDEDVEQQFTVPVDGHIPSTGFEADENTPLVRKPRGATRSASRRSRTATSTGPHGNATVTQAVMMACSHTFASLFSSDLFV